MPKNETKKEHMNSFKVTMFDALLWDHSILFHLCLLHDMWKSWTSISECNAFAQSNQAASSLFGWPAQAVASVPFRVNVQPYKTLSDSVIDAHVVTFEYQGFGDYKCDAQPQWHSWRFVSCLQMG